MSRSSRTSRDTAGGSKTFLGVAAAVAVCCGLVWVLVAAGVLAATGGLLGSWELTFGAAALALWGLWRLAVRVRRVRRGSPH